MGEAKTLLVRDRELYALVERDGALFLEIVFGGFAMYERRLELDAEERKSFEERGTGYLDDLAAAIRAQPDAYEARFAAGAAR